MGIPSFFRKIIKNNINIKSPDKDVDYFYIDFNSIIYNILGELNMVSLSKMHNINVEKIIFNSILFYLQQMICNVIKPLKCVYISIDGTPPMAKIVKQKNRRYKYVLETKFKKKLEKKWNKKIVYNNIASISILPGTVFMDKLYKFLVQKIKEGYLSKHIENTDDFYVYLNSYKVSGEGEHKIIRHISKYLKESDKVIYVYSPDADLILLLSMLNIKNIYLIKNKEIEKKDSTDENKESQTLTKDNLYFMSIDECKRLFNNLIINELILNNHFQGSIDDSTMNHEESNGTINDSTMNHEESNSTINDSTMNHEESNSTINDSTMNHEESNSTINDSTVIHEESNGAIDESSVIYDASNGVIDESSVIHEESNGNMDDSTVNYEEINDAHKESTDNYLLDYMCLTYFCGNDFVKESLFLRIKDNGIDILLQIYKKVKSNLPDNEYLIQKVNDNYVFNKRFLINLFKELSLVEEQYLQNLQKKRNVIRKGSVDANTIINSWEIEYNKYQHEEYYSPLHPQFMKYNALFNIINYYDKNWITEYHKFFFKDININDVCNDYINSLLFCLNYYMSSINVNNNFSWRYYYKYRVPPTFTDLTNYLINIQNNNSISFNYITEDNTPLTSFEQLLIVLPREYLFLLPMEIKTLILDDPNVDTLFPRHLILDVVYGTKFIYSDIIFNDITYDITNYKKYLDESNLSYVDKLRNAVEQNYLILKKIN